MRQIYNTSDTSPELMSFVLELSSGEHSPEYPGIQYQAYARAEHQTTEQPNREAAQLLTGLASNCDVSNCLTSPTTSVSSTASSPSGSCGTASPPSPPSVIYDGSIAGSLNSGTLGKAGTRLTLANLMPSRLAVTAPHVTHVISVGSLDVQCIVCPGSYADSKLSELFCFFTDLNDRRAVISIVSTALLLIALLVEFKTLAICKLDII